MTISLTSNLDVYCYLKSRLEPDYRVVAEPNADYFAQWQFCYRILRDNIVIEELSGDLRNIPENSLVKEAHNIVERLAPRTSDDSTKPATDAELPFASRLPPRRDDVTWFSSGRSAFAWLVANIARPKRLYLPTLVCWSLVDVMQQAFPDIELHFYSVTRKLQCDYPDGLNGDDAIVFIHYFGHLINGPGSDTPCIRLEDESHLLMSQSNARQTHSGGHRFGSLRKAYRAADGGFIRGYFNPAYSPRQNLDAWLRLNACDWRDMREAENMTDRSWGTSDISSQSLAVILKTDTEKVARQRQTNNAFLDTNFDVGQPMIQFRNDESPLLHNRLFACRKERDSLRRYLADRGMFTSIHWPIHPLLLKQRDSVDIEDAIWLEDHSLAIPVSSEFRIEHMERVSNAAHDWNRAGSARFVDQAAG